MKNGTRIQHLSASLIGVSFLLLLFLPQGTDADTRAQSAEEYAVKAAFVLNFVRFTQWPDDAFTGTDDPCFLYVVGNGALVSAFQTIDGKEIGSRRLRIRFVSGADDLQRCDAVFISKGIDRSALLRIFAAVKDRPVLTIGEMEGFIRLGGMINLFTEEGRLRFEVDPRRSREHRVKLSSRLLSLAVIVEGIW